MSLKFKRKYIVAKVESPSGTDAGPTGGLNAMLVRNLTISPLETTSEKLEFAGRLGAAEEVITGEHTVVEFEVGAAGSGAAGTPPAYGALIKGCDLTEVIAINSNTSYQQTITNPSSLTLYFHLDGIKFPLIGARGSLGLQMKSPGIPFWKFKFLGIWGAPVAAADPVPVYTAFKNPMPVSATTTTFSMFGHSLYLEEFTLDQNAQVAYRKLIGKEEVVISGREWKGSFTAEMPDVATWNIIQTVKDNTVSGLAMTHGLAGNGNSVAVISNSAQISNPKLSESDGIAMIQCDYTLIDQGAVECAINIS